MGVVFADVAALACGLDWTNLGDWSNLGTQKGNIRNQTGPIFEMVFGTRHANEAVRDAEVPRRATVNSGRVRVRISGSAKGLKLQTVDRIIKSLRDRGFETQIEDIVKFFDERGKIR